VTTPTIEFNGPMNLPLDLVRDRRIVFRTALKALVQIRY